ncbi:MAG: sigma-70 family RNA polymerase sigma factor [Acidobacteria bacterium]|nr:sigma-70 family RNA polymerase sigma factor [Acidobacteriota bacterium]
MTARSPATNGFASVGDAELVVRALRGRDDGFEELVRRYQRPIVSYVYRMTGDYESALDLTQEVFIKVYNSLARYSPEYKFSTWIYRARPTSGPRRAARPRPNSSASAPSGGPRSRRSSASCRRATAS